MKDDANNLSRSEKILLFLYEFGGGGQKKIRYEDIVVGLFKKYPHDFHLKGYTEYPDSGDLVHKPLYDFKKKGYVGGANKVFSLTQRGMEAAKQLTSKDTTAKKTGDRLSRSAATEVARIKALEGFGLFVQGEKEKISDSDFYNYLGVTVRTQKNTFIGRLETMNEVADELRKHKDSDLHQTIAEYHDFLVSKHEDIVSFFTKN